MIRRTLPLVLAAVAFAAPCAMARVFKCPGPNGATVYSDQPCTAAGGQKMDDTQLRANTVPAVRPPAPPAEEAASAPVAPAPAAAASKPAEPEPESKIVRMRILPAARPVNKAGPATFTHQ